MIVDSANEIQITNDNLINSMLKKIKPDTNIRIDDGRLIMDDLILSFYDQSGEKIYPHIAITNMSHKALFSRIAMSKLFDTSIVTLYVGARRSLVKAQVEPAPIGENSLLDQKFETVEKVNFDRYETMANLGMVYSLVYDRWCGEISYEFDKFFRGDDLTYMDTNHIIRAVILRRLTHRLSGYMGGVIMMHQFNTDLPYLYNRYTQSQFDKKYGFINLGIILSF